MMKCEFNGRKFKGNRNLESIIQDAQKLGWEVGREDYDNGSDRIWIRDLIRREMQVSFNTITGCFYVYTPDSDLPKATHLNTEFDDEDWYKELLNLFYVPFVPEGGAFL